MQPSAEHLERCRLVAELLDRHAAALALYAAQWTDDPDDCVQESLIELSRQAVLPQRPVAWLYCVVRRRALNAARSQRRRLAREKAAWRERLAGSATANDRGELLDAVAALAESRREIVLLRVWGNLTFGEIGEVLGRSSSAVHRDYTSAINELRQQWDLPCESLPCKNVTKTN